VIPDSIFHYKIDKKLGQGGRSWNNQEIT